MTQQTLELIETEQPKDEAKMLHVYCGWCHDVLMRDPMVSHCRLKVRPVAELKPGLFGDPICVVCMDLVSNNVPCSSCGHYIRLRR